MERFRRGTERERERERKTKKHTREMKFESERYAWRTMFVWSVLYDGCPSTSNTVMQVAFKNVGVKKVVLAPVFIKWFFI